MADEPRPATALCRDARHAPHPRARHPGAPSRRPADRRTAPRPFRSWARLASWLLRLRASSAVLVVRACVSALLLRGFLLEERSPRRFAQRSDTTPDFTTSAVAPITDKHMALLVTSLRGFRGG